MYTCITSYCHSKLGHLFFFNFYVLYDRFFIQNLPFFIEISWMIGSTQMCQIKISFLLWISAKNYCNSDSQCPTANRVRNESGVTTGCFFNESTIFCIYKSGAKRCEDGKRWGMRAYVILYMELPASPVMLWIEL